jgi:hypothetical protein
MNPIINELVSRLKLPEIPLGSDNHFYMYNDFDLIPIQELMQKGLSNQMEAIPFFFVLHTILTMIRFM